MTSPLPLGAPRRAGLAALALAALFVLAGAPALRAEDPPAYPETPEGLQRLTADVLAATRDGAKDQLARLFKGLALPQHEAWFKKTFGDEKGALLAADYGKSLPSMEAELGKLFAQMVEKGQTEVRTAKFDKAGDPEATGAQNDALAAMKTPTALYSVRLVKPGAESGMHLWSFVWADGGFRLAGKMKGVK